MTNSLYHFEMSPMTRDPNHNLAHHKRKSDPVDGYFRRQQSEDNRFEASIDFCPNNEEISGPEEIQPNHDVRNSFETNVYFPE